MELFDMHTHILPGVDDGAKDVEESIKLLEMLKDQGVTSVAATPHFIATQDNIEEFSERVQKAKEELFYAAKGKDLPKLYFGSEVLYFYGMGALSGIKDLTLNGSDYMLLEFDEINFDEHVCKDIKKIRDNWGITPIIAHIERYKKFKNYNNLLDLVANRVCLAQINASSVVGNVFSKTAYKLIKMEIVRFIASDAHSVDRRPPAIDKAYAVLTDKFGKNVADKIKANSQRLLEEIM